VPELAGHELASDRREAVLVVGIGHRILAAVELDQADVVVGPGARRVGERLRHERRDVALEVRELLDRVLVRERRVGAGHPSLGRVDDLPL
jgi:hypothetical protein